MPAIKSAVAALDHRRRIAFAAFWAQRLWPSYLLYSQRTGAGDPEHLRRCLMAAWAAAKGESVDPGAQSLMQERLVQLSPEIESPPVLAYAAMESVASTWDALNVIPAGSVDSAASACSGCSQVLYYFLMNRDHQGVRIASNEPDPLGLVEDPLWQREVVVLNDLLNRLADTTSSADEIEAIRATADNADAVNLARDIADLSRRLSQPG